MPRRLVLGLDTTAQWALKSMIVEVESVAGNCERVRRIRLDNGGEFIGEDLSSWFLEAGIMPEYYSGMMPASRFNRFPRQSPMGEGSD